MIKRRMPSERYRPVESRLDLAVDPVLDPRPNSVDASPDAELRRDVGESSHRFWQRPSRPRLPATGCSTTTAW